ncbi:hypothetical protein [Spirillospora sp. CA-294931]|uniref:hypothetical protein n=1 Tax=Spirillospora sp. CA-294931 TaxID=3240042 RepID=UPI003D94C1E2
MEEYLATLVDAEPRTLAEYRRDYATHIAPAVVVLPGERRQGRWAGCRSMSAQTPISGRHGSATCGLYGEMEASMSECEVFQFLAWRWDVTKAKQLATDLPIQ